MKQGAWLARTEELGVRDMVELGVAAEEAGWDGVFVSDSIYSGYTDPWTLLAAIADRTTDVTLGTWISPIGQQLPWRVAHALASLDHLSEGRMLLGVGLGVYQEYEQLGEEYDAATLARRYDEALDVMAALWTGEPCHHDGEFYRLDGLQLPVTPVQQPRIPIVVAGWWPNRAPFDRAARWDGVMPAWPAMLGDQAGPEGQEPSGRPLGEELRDVIDHYTGLTDDPGEIVVPRPREPEPDFDELCAELGVTWQLSGRNTRESIEAGPPN